MQTISQADLPILKAADILTALCNTIPTYTSGWITRNQAVQQLRNTPTIQLPLPTFSNCNLSIYNKSRAIIFSLSWRKQMTWMRTKTTLPITLLSKPAIKPPVPTLIISSDKCLSPNHSLTPDHILATKCNPEKQTNWHINLNATHCAHCSI
jgi:hypothetical protein